MIVAEEDVRAHIEIWGNGGPRLVPLDGDRVELGKHRSNGIAIGGDRMLSRMHAVFERYPAGWAIRDLASRNGTFVNGERVWAERPLHDGDEIRAGGTRMVFRKEPALRTGTETGVEEAAPLVTRREREVLVSLCRPVLAGDVFTQPASIHQVAEDLFVTDNGVKQHLMRLYIKFGILEDAENRRTVLANEAIRRGVVTYADLRLAREARRGR